MYPKEPSAQPGSSSQAPIIIDDQTSRGNNQPKTTTSARTTSAEDPSKQLPHDPGTVDTIYKIVYSDRREYSLPGKVYFRYNLPPERDSTGWYSIVAFHWHDVQAEFECIYHPSIKLFDNFKAVPGSLSGGRGGIQSVQISMWNFAYRGPDLNAKHTVLDDSGNRIMLALMVLRDRSFVKLYGKLVREGVDADEVWLSEGERRRLGMRW